MILYQGTLYEPHHQQKLLTSLEEDCFKTLNTTDHLQTGDVINACDVLTKRVLKGEFNTLIMPLLEEFDIPYGYFEHYVSMFSRDSLTKKVKIELGSNYQALSSLDEHNKRVLRPLGILFHIAAGNVDVLPAYSVIEGLLGGNINILKLPTFEKGGWSKLLYYLINI